MVGDNRYLRDFGLHHDGRGRFDSITPQQREEVANARPIATAHDVVGHKMTAHSHATGDARDGQVC
jgi:hypothetical protein